MSYKFKTLSYKFKTLSDKFKTLSFNYCVLGILVFEFHVWILGFEF